MERFNFVLLVAGFGFFGLSFVIMGLLPIAQYSDVDVVTMEQLSQDIPYQFEQLAEEYAEEFQKAFGTTEATPEVFADAIQEGKKIYIAEACWHCHTQQIRRVDPNDGLEVGHDISRFSPDKPYESVSTEYYNEMNYPHLFGTRRIGPDLFAESGRHPNDWHIAHFWNPRLTSPYSVMPPYRWFFDDDEGLVPNRKALSLVAYMQWLGSWRKQFAPTEYANLPVIPFDESWYPPVEIAPEDQGAAEDEGDEYGGDEEDY